MNLKRSENALPGVASAEARDAAIMHSPGVSAAFEKLVEEDGLADALIFQRGFSCGVS